MTMRLLLITNIFPSPLHPTKGVFNLELARALSRLHDVRVICPIAWTEELAAFRHGRQLPAGRTHVVDQVSVHFPRYYFSPKVMRRHYGAFMWHSVRGTVRRELEQFPPDAVIGYWAHPDGEVAVRAARLARVPSVVMVGGSDVLLMTGHPARRRCVLNVLHAADAVVPVSQSLRQKLIEFGIEPAKLHVVERGVDTSVFHPGDRDAARRRVGIDFTGPVMVWVGRMVPVKGLDVLLAACAELRRRGLNFQLCLVGDGPLRSALEQQSRAAGLHAVVRFTGTVAHHQLADWYRAADVMVLPSHSEGVPNVLREAAACGIPYVASRVGGIPELSDFARNCLVPPGDPAALAGALGAFTGAKPIQVEDPASGLGVSASWADAAGTLAEVVGNLLDARRTLAGVAC
jgi:teichuronic acid biosynthesis glycosyltransferase TuaC